MIFSTLLQNRVVLAPFQNRVVLFLSPQNLVVLSYSLQNHVTPYLLQSCMVYSLFISEPHGLLSLWLPGLGLNPSAHLPLQPHF